MLGQLTELLGQPAGRGRMLGGGRDFGRGEEIEEHGEEERGDAPRRTVHPGCGEGLRPTWR